MISSKLSVNKELAVLIEHNDHTHEENSEEDDNEAPGRSKR
jgi:hypothetical protein